MAIQALLFFKPETSVETSSKDTNECSASTVFDGFTLVNSFWKQDETISFLQPTVRTDKVNFPAGTTFVMVEVAVSRQRISEFGKTDYSLRLHVDEYNLDSVQGLFPHNTTIKFDTNFTNLAADLVFCGENISVIEKLLQSGVNISYRSKRGGTMAHYAATRSSISLIPVLQRCGVDLNRVGSDGFTPLHIAVQEKNLEIVRVFLDNGANPNIPTADGHSPLYLAVKAGFSDAFVVLIERGADPNALKEEKHVLPNHFSSLASEVDDSKIIEILLRVGFDYDCIATVPASLMNAVERKDVALVQKLLEHGACPHQEHRRKVYHTRDDIFGSHEYLSIVRTAIRRAYDLKDEKMLKLFLDHGAIGCMRAGCGQEISSLVENAVETKNSKMLSFLFKNGATVHDYPYIFELAVGFDEPPYDMIRFLAENGYCDVHSQSVSHDSKTILYVYEDNEEGKLKMILKYGGFLDFSNLVSAICNIADEWCEEIKFLDAFFACCFTDIKEPRESNEVRGLFKRVNLVYSETVQSDYDNELPPRKVPAGMLAKHMVKLSAAGKQINERVIPAEINDYFGLDVLRAQCREEIDLMKRNMVCGSDISFISMC